jgi:hypothetical protein
MQHFTSFFLNSVQFAGGQRLLMVECCFCYGGPGFNFTRTSSIVFYQSIQICEIDRFINNPGIK